VPDSFVTKDENGVATGTPTKAAQKDGVEEAHVVTDEEVTLGGIEAVEAVSSAHVRKAEGKVCANTEKSLDGDEFASEARLTSGIALECRKGSG
jgi:hypothetical protein